MAVAVRQVRREGDVLLRGPGRQAGRRADALDVEDHRRDLGVVGQAGELGHQRDARAGGRGHRPGAGPGRADDHAEGGDLVLGLDHGEARLAGLLVDAVLAQVVDQRLAERRRRRDRVPGDDGDAGEEAAERGGGVALDEDLPRRLVHPLDADVGLGEVGLGVLEALVERGAVQRHRLGLLARAACRGPSSSRPARCRAGTRGCRRRSCCARAGAAWRRS